MRFLPIFLETASFLAVAVQSQSANGPGQAHRTQKCAWQISRLLGLDQIAVRGSRALFRTRHDFRLLGTRQAILPFQLSRISVDADPLAVLQNETGNRSVGVDGRMSNRLNENEGKKPY
jgi:hypothetical protein